MEKSPAAYSNDNPKFRKAVIRERLNALKTERDALVAERDALDKTAKLIAEAKANASQPIRPSNTVTFPMRG